MGACMRVYIEIQEPYGNLYASVKDLDGTYVQPGVAKDALLHPVMLLPAVSANSTLFRLLPPPPSSGEPKEFFMCDYCRVYVTDTSGTTCPCFHGGSMTTLLQFVPGDQAVGAGGGGGAAAKGFVQGVVAYTVMDNLRVTPMSSISSITSLLNSFAVKDLAALQEKTVQLGYDQGLEILKASLQCKRVLTDVFLGKKIGIGNGSA